MAIKKHREPASEIAVAIEHLKREKPPTTGNANLYYRIGVLLLGQYATTGKTKFLRQARAELTRAVEVRPKHARSHAMLGYACDLTNGGAEQALACFREARRHNLRNKIYEVYLLTLLQEAGREREALAGIKTAAPRHRVDIHSLRRDLRKSSLPTDAKSLLLNDFISARHYFESSLLDESESIMNSLQPDRKRAEAVAERQRCVEDQRELEQSFDASRVPEPLRALGKWASLYGVGDDLCRPYLFNRLSKKRRTELIRKVDRHAEAIQEWLDSFRNKLLPTEAAAFMYLMVGVEEIREAS